jgi:hypothetical protein
MILGISTCLFLGISIALGLYVRKQIESQQTEKSKVSPIIGNIFMLKVPGKHDLCVDDGGGRKSGQTQFHLWTCDKNNENQHFTYDATTQQIRNPNKDNLCVDDGGGTARGQTRFHLWTCDPNNVNQKFVYDPNTKMFNNPQKNNLCMDDGGGTALGQTKFHLWTCDTNNANQKFEAIKL